MLFVFYLTFSFQMKNALCYNFSAALPVFPDHINALYIFCWCIQQSFYFISGARTTPAAFSDPYFDYEIHYVIYIQDETHLNCIAFAMNLRLSIQYCLVSTQRYLNPCICHQLCGTNGSQCHVLIFRVDAIPISVSTESHLKFSVQLNN